MSDDEDCLYERYIEPNRYRIVKYFDPYVVFDIMRQQGVMTMDDQERVQNMYPPTRRARAGQFLDILQTKGDDGVQKFIDVLEYDYPHVYKLITNKDAKEPPRGFKQHRESIRSKWIDRLGEFVDAIKNTIADNSTLKEQLEDVKGIVNLNQENIQAAENDNNCLREQVRMMTEELRAFKDQNSSLLHDRDRLKDDNLRIQRDCLEYFKEKDHYKDKLNEVQQEKEHLENENRVLANTVIHLKQSLTHTNRDSSRVEKVEQIQNKLRNIDVNESCVARLEIEKNILKDELAETQVKSEELAEDLDNLRAELDRAQKECLKFRDKVEKEKGEKSMMEEWLQEKNKKLQNYYERIGELEKDKENLEGERNREQQKNKDLDQKYSRLFNEKHKQEQMIDLLKLEVQELKFQIRKSGELPSETSIPDNNEATATSSNTGYTMSNKSSESDDDLTMNVILETALTENIQLEIAVEILPWKIDDYAGRPTSVINRTGSLDETRDKWTVRMKMPNLDKLSIVGGNFTGIFVLNIDRMPRRLDVPKPGDKIQSISRITENYCQQETTFFEGFTHSQAREKLYSKHHSDDIEMTFRRSKINEIPEYECAKKWMADNKNSKRGDYFYVRANIPLQQEKSTGHKIQVGDVFLVQDTCPATFGDWQALKFDKKRGDWGPLCQSIPDSAHNRRQVIMNRQHSGELLPGRKMAVKKKNLYTNVFPMKAVSMLPVWMIGPQDVVTAIQNLVCKHFPSDYVISDTSNLAHMMNSNKKKHVLMHVNQQSKVDKIGILLLFSVKTKDPNILSQVLNTQVIPDASTINENKLKGLDHEEILIPSGGTKTEEELVNTVNKKIKVLQKRIIWLCEDQLRKYKSEILEDYKCFFTENNMTSIFSKSACFQEDNIGVGQDSTQESSSSSGLGEPIKSRSEDGMTIDKDRDICNSWIDTPEDDC